MIGDFDMSTVPVTRIGPSNDLSWSFDEASRTIVLSKDEALLQVAKDSRRPFIDVTQIGDLCSVGAEFAARILSAPPDVVLARGEVAVKRHADFCVVTMDRGSDAAELVDDRQIILSDSSAQS